MKCNLQCVPTPTQWVGRHKTEPKERIGAGGAFVDAAWSHSFVEDAEDNHEILGTISSLVTLTEIIDPGRGFTFVITPYNIPTFHSGQVENIDQGPNIEILSSRAADAPAFDWDFTILLRTGLSESAAARADDGSFSWDFTILTSPAAPTETIGGSAGQKIFSCGPLVVQDDMESYTDGAALHGLAGGKYVDRNNGFNLNVSDDLESYTDGAALNGLAGGNYADRDTNLLLASDDMESYTDGDALNGLGAYVDR
jgi:hypothetical protein